MDFQSAKSFGKLRLRAFQPYHPCYICQHCRYKTRISNVFNAILCRHCRYKTHPHIPAHNFLNIQWIFNPQKVLESWDLGLFNHTTNTIYVDTVDTRQGSLMHSMLSMSTLSIQTHIHTFLPITFLIFNGFSICKKFWKAETQGFSTIPSMLIYVNTVNTRQVSLMHSMLSMSTLSIQNTSTHSCP